MTDEDRERQKRRILDVFADWASPEEWRAFMRAHGSPAEAMVALAVLERMIERDRWFRWTIWVAVRVAAGITTLIVAFEGLKRIFPSVETWFSQ